MADATGASQTTTSAPMNFRLAPGGLDYDSAKWTQIGTVTSTGTETVSVTLSTGSTNSGAIPADAILFKPTGLDVARTTYEWDHQNRLTKVTNESAAFSATGVMTLSPRDTTTYAYDVLDRIATYGEKRPQARTATNAACTPIDKTRRKGNACHFGRPGMRRQARTCLRSGSPIRLSRIAAHLRRAVDAGSRVPGRHFRTPAWFAGITRVSVRRCRRGPWPGQRGRRPPCRPPSAAARGGSWRAARPARRPPRGSGRAPVGPG